MTSDPAIPYVKVIKKKEPNIELVNSLSGYVLKRFIAKDDCKSCWGLGMRIVQRFPNSNFIYQPCSCLKHKGDANETPK